MKFKFKIQGYQTEAVDNTTAIFTGQPNRDSSKYRRDLGKRDSGIIRFDGDDDGYRNADVELSSKQLLDNLRSVQTSAGVPLSKSLSKIEGLGAVNLDVEMDCFAKLLIVRVNMAKPCPYGGVVEFFVKLLIVSVYIVKACPYGGGRIMKNEE